MVIRLKWYLPCHLLLQMIASASFGQTSKFKRSYYFWHDGVERVDIYSDAAKFLFGNYRFAV